MASQKVIQRVVGPSSVVLRWKVASFHSLLSAPRKYKGVGGQPGVDSHIMIQQHDAKVAIIM